ncbi:MAG TPA: GGDEF domain-containing response regulator [Bdellovibrionota bacterium]|nr:GGDEF domain-containing response regulator [Bdellovibrionota bacterium]
MEERPAILAIEPCCGKGKAACDFLHLSDQFLLYGASSLAEGLKLLQERSIDLIILDLMISDNEGLDTFLRVKREAPHMPVIIVTTLEDESVAMEAVKQGAQDYLLKQEVDTEHLSRSIRYAIARNRLLLEVDFLREQEHYLATHDKLTNLPNRYLFGEYLEKAVANAGRSGSKLAVLFIDLDGFKQINDQWGHAAGDHVLQSVAERLKEAVRHSDVVGRVGGDEFIAMLCNIENRSDAGRVAREMLRAVRHAVLFCGRRMVVDISIGISICPGDGRRLDDLISKADMAMYKAKKRKGRHVQFYVPPRLPRVREVQEPTESPETVPFESPRRTPLRRVH